LKVSRATRRVSWQVRRDFDRVPRAYAAAVAAALRSLSRDPRAGKPLRGDIADLQSLRIGTYRLVYRFDQRRDLLDIVWIHHGSEAYRSAR